MKMRLRLENLEPDEKLTATLNAVFEKTMSYFDVDKPSVDLLITNDAALHELNKKWRKIDKATDVLSFAAREGSALKQLGVGEHLGDIAISYETALRQAAEYGHCLEREMSFLLVHGLLHLLGYDHITKEEETEMFSLQNEILGSRSSCV